MRAVPSAQGFGVETVHGRGGQILFIGETDPMGDFLTYLNESGPRIIVPRWCGTLDFDPTQTFTITEPFLYFAGQRAPGQGITLKGCNLVVGTHDVVLRGLRSRIGSLPGGIDGQRRDALRIGSETDGEVYKVLVDHCSFSWSVDETVEVIGANTHDITISYCFISEPLSLAGHPKTEHSKALSAHNTGGGRVTFHHNVIAHSLDRNPQMLSPAEIECVNNVFYNCAKGGRFGNNAQVHFIGNRYVPGPNTPANTYGLILLQGDMTNPRVYVRGNVGHNRPTNSGDEWLICRDSSVYRSLVPLFVENVVAEDVDAMWPGILDKVGCLPHDAVDERVKGHILSGTGAVINSQDDVGGWPVIVSVPPLPDSDGDGMDDEWESARQLVDNDPSDDRNGNGYTDPEDYVNEPLDGVQFEIPPPPLQAPTVTLWLVTLKNKFKRVFWATTEATSVTVDGAPAGLSGSVVRKLGVTVTVIATGPGGSTTKTIQVVQVEA